MVSSPLRRTLDQDTLLRIFDTFRTLLKLHKQQNVTGQWTSGPSTSTDSDKNIPNKSLESSTASEGIIGKISRYYRSSNTPASSTCTRQSTHCRPYLFLAAAETFGVTYFVVVVGQHESPQEMLSCPMRQTLDQDTLLSILFYSRLCPSTVGSSPPPESSIFLCPLLSLSIPLPVAPQCHLSNHVLVFRLILHPFSATVFLIVHLLFFIPAMCPAHFHFVLVTCWTMSVTLVLCLMVVTRILSFYLDIKHFPFHGSLTCFKFHTLLCIVNTSRPPLNSFTQQYVADQ